MQPSASNLAQHTEALRRIARSLLHSAADADDVLQDAWLASSRRSPDNVEDPQAWMTGTIRNLVRNVVRDHASRRARETRSARAEALLEDPSSPISREETRRAVRQAVEKLDEPQRTVIELHYFEGLSTREVARRTEVSQASVQRYLRLACDSLQTSLRAEYEGSERLLGIALIGAFSWERRDFHAAALATETAASGALLGVLSRWLIAGLVLLAGIGALVLRNDAIDERVAPEPEQVATLSLPGNRPEGDDGVEPIGTARSARAKGEEAEAASAALPLSSEGRESESDTDQAPTPPTEQRFLVVDPTGVPVMGAEILAPGPYGDIVRATTDADGRATVD
ncbi:MAG: sigma-70 family RNA polymerase sigma factor, partial [Planctomycetota bacterium]